MAVVIKTDHKWKPFKYAHDVPKKVLKTDFDYHKHGEDEDAPCDGYIHYKGVWYHTDQFMRGPENAFGGGWHGYLNDSFSSGVVIALSDDGETYKIGTFFSKS